MSGLREWLPGDVEPAGAGQQLVGVVAMAQEIDQALELDWIFGANVGSLAEEMLGILDATNKTVDARIAEAGVDDDGADLLPGRL